MTLMAEQPLSCDAAHVDSYSNDGEMRDVQQRLEEQGVILEILMKIFDIKSSSMELQHRHV